MKLVVSFALAVVLTGAASTPRARSFNFRGEAVEVVEPEDAAHQLLHVQLFISSNELPLRETLAFGGWEPVDAGDSCEPQPLTQGQPATWSLETPDADAGRLILWRRAEHPSSLPLWVATFATDAGNMSVVRTLLADGISEERIAHDPHDAGLPWVELRYGPYAAEDAPLPDELDSDPQPFSQNAITRVPLRPRRIALTFDACATLDHSQVDEKVIAALREAQVPATLFISGAWAEARPELVAELARDPLFEIGNHSYSHPHMTYVSPNRRREELLWAQRVLFQITGVVPTLFRPPFGEYNEALVSMATAMGLITIEYDLPSGDPDPKFSSSVLTQWVLSRATNGSVVVMHMNGRGRHTAQALPAIIKGLRAKGFVLSKITDLLTDAPNRRLIAGAVIP